MKLEKRWIRKRQRKWQESTWGRMKKCWIQFDDLAVTEEAYQSLADKVQEYGINDNPPAFGDFVYQAGENKKGE